MLGLINLLHGESIQTSLIFRKVKALHEISFFSLRSFNSLLQGSQSELYRACKVLGLKAKIPLILELNSLFHPKASGKLEMPELLRALDLGKESSGVITSLVKLMCSIPLVRIYQSLNMPIAAEV